MGLLIFLPYITNPVAGLSGVLLEIERRYLRVGEEWVLACISFVLIFETRSSKSIDFSSLVESFVKTIDT